MGNSDRTNFSRREFLEQTLYGLGTVAIVPPFTRHWFSQNQKYYEKWRQIKELPNEEKLGIALVGLGGYASGQLAPALQETKLCKLNGIVTGTPAKEDRWARKYNIPSDNIYNYDTYDRISENDDIDIIYIVLPNSMHAEYTIRGAKAGKHMISEKPMATSVEDAQAMVEACKKANKKLSIGYRLHFEPHHEEIMRLGQNEILGSVSSIEGGHAFRLTDPSRWRVDKKLAGGGPLMDLGIYVVQASIYTMGKLPLSVTARSETHNKKIFDEVEETIHWELEFPGQVTAKGMTSYSKSENYHDTDTTNGWIRMGPAYSYGGLQGKTSESALDYPEVNQQALQMDAFADCVLNDHQSRVPGEMGIRDVKILYAIYEAADTGQKVEFEWGDDALIDDHA